jgi:hypothetical protein
MSPRSYLPLIAASAILAGCGSSASAGTGTGTGGGPSADNHAKALAFAACMRAHGVPTFPDPKTGSGGEMQIQSLNGNTKVNGVAINGPAFQSAMQACRSKLPNGGHPQALTGARKQAMLKFSACMRSHGEPHFPDPTFSGDGGGLMIDKRSGIDPNSPAFKKAQQACQSLIGKVIRQGP